MQSHCQSALTPELDEGEKGIGDIEIFFQGEEENNMILSGVAIEPND